VQCTPWQDPRDFSGEVLDQLYADFERAYISDMNQSSSRLALVTAVLISASFTGTAFAQAASAVITKSFSPAVVALNGTSIATITVTNPNVALPLTNVQFSDTMPAGIDLITQTGGTCSTLATGGGMFTINPGTEFFSSTSSVLAGGQSCTITVSVRGAALGVHLNTTSQVTSTNAPPGAAASATLTVQAVHGPTLSAWMLMALAAALAVAAAIKLRG
jgi:uncharacterized repeat protein (TIGR01451 family)